jgi:aminoglycoside phosphotransferase (APT) family kinase protein
MNHQQQAINTALVQRLIASQFPQWKDLPIHPIALSGWDNRTFHLGKDKLVRMPSHAEYATAVEKEHRWLPKLGPLLPLPIPEPLALGKPGEGYPWKWSIYRFLEGESAAVAPIHDLKQFAATLAEFLNALQQIDATGGPVPGPDNFYRGGPLMAYDSQTREAIGLLQDRLDTQAVLKLWEVGLETSWQKAPVWVHGDVSTGNLLMQEGKLCAVIDFGQLAIGDPACDLAIAWTLFQGESREIFRATLKLDDSTWVRGRAWALWKALIIAAGFTSPNNAESVYCWRTIDEVLAECRTG